MASGLWSLQLQALTCTHHRLEDTAVSLAPLPPLALVKNERNGHHLELIIIPTWVEEGVTHPPPYTVAALRHYIPPTEGALPDYLWVWHDSL